MPPPTFLLLCPDTLLNQRPFHFLHVRRFKGIRLRSADRAPLQLHHVLPSRYRTRFQAVNPHAIKQHLEY